MLGLTTGLGAVAWMASGAVLALAGMALRQKILERRETRRRGDWDAY